MSNDENFSPSPLLSEYRSAHEAPTQLLVQRMCGAERPVARTGADKAERATSIIIGAGDGKRWEHESQPVRLQMR